MSSIYFPPLLVTCIEQSVIDIMSGSGKVSNKLDNWMTAGIKLLGSPEHHQFASAPSQQSRWEERLERLTLYNQTQDAVLGLLPPAAGRHPARQPRGQARRVFGRALQFGHQLYIDI